MPSLRPFAAYIEDHQEAIIKRLSDAVAIPSISADPERRGDVFKMASCVIPLCSRVNWNNTHCVAPCFRSNPNPSPHQLEFLLARLNVTDGYKPNARVWEFILDRFLWESISWAISSSICLPCYLGRTATIPKRRRSSHTRTTMFNVRLLPRSVKPRDSLGEACSELNAKFNFVIYLGS
jgi:hypothetical protein